MCNIVVEAKDLALMTVAKRRRLVDDATCVCVLRRGLLQVQGRGEGGSSLPQLQPPTLPLTSLQKFEKERAEGNGDGECNASLEGEDVGEGSKRRKGMVEGEGQARGGGGA